MITMVKITKTFKNIQIICLIGFFLILSLKLSNVNFLLFHSLAEVIAISVMWTLPIIILNTLDENKEQAIVFLAIAYLFIGLIDLFHTLSYKGMMIIGSGDDANPATQLWIAARYLESLTLLVFPFILHKSLRIRIVFSGYMIVTAGIFLSIFVFRVFPDCYIEGYGLTRFKIVSEYLISGILVGSLIAIYHKREQLDSRVFWFYVLSIAATIGSEILFTFYISVYGLSNLVGHLLKLVSVYYIYKALIYTGLRKPYSLLNKAIIDSSRKYQQMFEMNKAVKILIDPASGAIIEVNQSACDFYGYTKQEFEALNITDLEVLPEADVVSVLTSLRHEEFEVVHAKHRLSTGCLRDVELYIGPIEIDDRRYLFAIIIDVTMRLLSDARLRESEEKYRRIADNVTDVIWVTDLEMNPTFISPSVKRVYGIEPEEFLQRPISESYSQASLDECRRVLHEELQKEHDPAADKNRIFEFEVERLRNDGSRSRDAVRARFVRGEQGQAVAVLGASRDITEQVRIEEALRQSEERFRALHNASFGGIAIHDGGMILECNQGLAEITGYAASDLVGMDGLLLIAEDHRETVMKNILLGHESSYEVFGLRKDGERYPLRLEARNIPYKGKSVRVVEFRDISEQRLAEEENKRLQEKLMQSQKMDAVGRLAGGVAHDFNNMLGAIIGYAELILVRMDGADPVYHDVEEILKAANRSAELTQQLLAFSRKQTIAPKVLDVNEMIGQTFKMLRKMIGEDVELVWQPCQSVCKILMDSSQFNQILVNLCINARDAIAANGRISIRTSLVTSVEAGDRADLGDPVSGEYVLLTIDDDGCGMDQDTLERIFEPFYSQKGQNGTGLGMSTVYGIIKQNKGFITVDSELGKGTTIKTYFSQHTGPAAESDPASSADLPDGQVLTILLVDDEQVVRDMARTVLGRLGHHVLAAETPQLAIELARLHHDEISLLLTDVIMPGMNGRELSVEATRLCPQLRTLFMSGYTADVIASQGILDEGVSFIQKPFSLKELSMKVSEVMQRSAHV